ncbi:MAG: protein-export chaperone SecB [Gammaproteobacteria bacterium]|nr:protein-export chaperone SecB [Gammaproteobacteria bacterium]MCP5459570.1 protein-export chaperone SecB [Gammaproteobacteria bacterium]
MSDGQRAEQQSAQQFEIHQVYLKDASFEAPHSPMIAREQGQPEVKLQLSNHSTQLAEDLYEVVLNLTVTSILGDKTVYLVEIDQAGLFGLKGFSGQQLDHVLGAYCPNALFPFARETIASMIGKGGFAPLLLSPINFDALYMQRLQSQQANQAPQPPGAET